MAKTEAQLTVSASPSPMETGFLHRGRGPRRMDRVFCFFFICLLRIKFFFFLSIIFIFYSFPFPFPLGINFYVFRLKKNMTAIKTKKKKILPLIIFLTKALKSPPSPSSPPRNLLFRTFELSDYKSLLQPINLKRIDRYCLHYHLLGNFILLRFLAIFFLLLIRTMKKICR